MVKQSTKQKYSHAIKQFKNNELKESIASMLIVIKELKEIKGLNSDVINMVFNALTNIGMAYGKLKKYESSIQFLRKSIEYARKNLISSHNIAHNYFLMAISFHNADDKKKEIEALKRASTLGYDKATKLLEKYGLKFFTISNEEI